MSQNANDLIERLKQELSIRKDKELCELLDIKHNTLSTWRKRDSIDFNKVIALCELKGLDLNFIFFEEDNDGQNQNKPSLPPLKQEHFAKEFKIKPLMSSKLINSYRNIALFIHINQHVSEHYNEIIVTQRLSVKKLSENTKYIFELKSGNFLKDTLLLDTAKSISTIYLVNNILKLKFSEISKVWQVLGESMMPI